MLHNIFIIREDGVVIFSKSYSPPDDKQSLFDSQSLIEKTIEKIAEKDNLIIFKNFTEAIISNRKILFFPFQVDENFEITIIVSVDLTDSNARFKSLLDKIACIFGGIFLDIAELGSLDDYKEFETNLDEFLSSASIIGN